MFEQLLLQYLFVPLMLLSSFIAGELFFCLFTPKIKTALTIFSVFSKIVTGTIIIVTIYSLIKTNGYTINILNLILLIFYAFQVVKVTPNDKSFVISKVVLIKLLVALLFISILFYSLYLMSVYNFKEHYYTDTFCDWQFYAEISKYLNAGFENLNQFDNFVFNQELTPYHYFEIWIAALISNVFQISSQIAVSVITPTYLLCVVLIGFLTFVNHLNAGKILISFLVLFFSWISILSFSIAKIGYPQPFLPGLISSVVFSYKLLPILIIFLMSVYYFINKQNVLAIFILLFIPVFSTVSGISVFIFVWVIVSYLILIKRQIVEYKFLILYLTIFSFAFLLFYLVFYKKSLVENSAILLNHDTYFILLSKPFVLLAYIIPWILFFYFYNKKIKIEDCKKRTLILSYFLILAIACGLMLVIANNFDSIQLFTNIFMPLSTCFVGVYLLNLKLEKRLKNYFIYGLFFIILLSSMLHTVKSIYYLRKDNSDVLLVKKILEQNSMSGKIIKIGFIHSLKLYSENTFNSAAKIFHVEKSIDAYCNNVMQVAISDFTALDNLKNNHEFEFDKNQALQRIKEGTFFKYVKAEQSKGRKNSIADYQAEFILKNNISYLLVDKSVKIQEQVTKITVPVLTENTTGKYLLIRVLN